MAARSNLQRVRLWEEPNGSFGIDGTGTLGNFLDLRSMESAFTPDRVSLPDQRARAYRVDQAKDQHGFKNTTYDWSGHLISHGITLNAAASASPTIDGLGQFLKTTMGGRTVSNGSLVVGAPAPTTSTFSVTGTQGSRFVPGQIIWVQNTTLGTYHPAKVKTVAIDALTLACALSFTPATGAIVLNSETFYETDKPNTSLQMIVEGENRNGDVYVLLGCHGDLTLTLTHGQLAMAASKMQVAQWLPSASAAGTPASAAALLHSLTGSLPVPFTASSCVFAPSGASTRVAPSIDEIGVSIAVTYGLVNSLNGVEGVAERVRVSSEVTCTISLPVNDTTPDEYVTARDAGTTYQLIVNLNSETPGKLLALEMGTVQIRSVKRSMKRGLRYQELTCLALADDNATDKTTDQRRSPIRLARG